MAAHSTHDKILNFVDQLDPRALTWRGRRERRGAPWSRKGGEQESRNECWRPLETGPAESGGSELIVAPAAASCGPADFVTSLGAAIVCIAKPSNPGSAISRQLQLATGKTRRETRTAWIPRRRVASSIMAGGVTLFGPFPSELAETSCGSVTVGHGGPRRSFQT